MSGPGHNSTPFKPQKLVLNMFYVAFHAEHDGAAKGGMAGELDNSIERWRWDLLGSAPAHCARPDALPRAGQSHRRLGRESI